MTDALPQGNGDCFMVAAKSIYFGISSELTSVLKAVGAQPGTITIVHAMVSAGKNLGYMRHIHAWVEFNDLVLDFSNGNTIVYPKHLYYAQGSIEAANPCEYRTYTAADVSQNIRELEHWGPWDSCFDERVAA